MFLTNFGVIKFEQSIGNKKYYTYRNRHFIKYNLPGYHIRKRTTKFEFSIRLFKLFPYSTTVLVK